MPSHFHKFLFLGIIVALALFSRVAYPTFYAISNGTNGKSVTAASAAPPVFILQPTSASSSPAVQLQVAQAAILAQPTGQDPAGSHILATTSADASPPAIADHASLIADLQTGNVLYGTNVDARWPLASISKLMTATIVLDKFDAGAHVTVTPAAAAVDPRQGMLRAGDAYTVGDLLRVLLLPSSNVAAEALAEAMPEGGRPQFLAEMNARAAAWGMADTHYEDPSGLSSGNQSTARDLLLLAQKIYANYPQILAITRTPQVTITELGSGRVVPVKSINDFAGRADFIGGKTGYTDEAAGNLLSIFSYGNRAVLIVALGTEDGLRFADTLKLYHWFMQNFK